ncbi:MAG TPA: sigma-70 family RNA polymerase sigma factor [Ktedonobacterales bacterium]
MHDLSAPSAGVRDLFACVMEQTQGSLCSFVRGLVGSAEQARDIVQDVFVDAWRAARAATPPFDGDGDGDGMRRWLFHVAYRRAAASLRHDHVLRFESLEVAQDGEPDQFYEPDRFEDRVVEGDLLQKALAQVGPQDAACLLLNVVQGFTAIEIAGILDIGPLAAKKRLSRAKQRLRNAYFTQSASPWKEA